LLRRESCNAERTCTSTRPTDRPTDISKPHFARRDAVNDADLLMTRMMMMMTK
jgi:hypothetical protein